MGINFTKVKDNAGNDDYSPLPNGRYNVEVESGEKKESKAGNEMIEFTFKVIEGDHANRKLWHTFSLLPQAQIYLLKFLEAAGSDVINQEGEVSTREIIQDVVGSVVNAYVEITSAPNSDKKRNQISGNFKPYESQETSPKQSNAGSGDSSGSSKKSKLFQ